MNQRDANQRMLKRLAVFGVAMFGFGFAMVPFYQRLCEVTGINELVQPAARAANTQVDTSRWVTLEFDANTHAMPWKFEPLTRSVRVRPGELVQIAYAIENTGAEALVGQAIPSYGPKVAAEHVRKLECFCFRQQALAPGERREMPVQFVVDAALPQGVTTVTLSYTFFEVKGTGAGAGQKDRTG